jgi:hypothetical protein
MTILDAQEGSVSETNTVTPIDPNTGAGLIQFLDAAIEKGWINVSTAKALRTATQKIFEVESGWESVDLRSLDADSLYERFRNLKRNSYSDDSMRIYKTRFGQALKMHLARIDGDPNWKSYGPSTRVSAPAKSASNGTKSASKASADKAAATTQPVAATNGVEDEDSPAPTSSTPLMRFPFPLRDTVDVWLTLPRDLMKDEAERLAIFIRSLARAEGQIPASSKPAAG